jgi:hypothetical protein
MFCVPGVEPSAIVVVVGVVIIILKRLKHLRVTMEW